MSWYISLCLLIKTSSSMPLTHGTVLMTAYSLLEDIKLTDRPNGNCNHLNFCHGVSNAVNNELSLSNPAI